MDITKEELKEFNELKQNKEFGRPFYLPSSLTINEYNFLVSYLTKQRGDILNSNPKIPKEIKAEAKMKSLRANAELPS